MVNCCFRLSDNSSARQAVSSPVIQVTPDVCRIARGRNKLKYNPTTSTSGYNTRPNHTCRPCNYKQKGMKNSQMTLARMTRKMEEERVLRFQLREQLCASACDSSVAYPRPRDRGDSHCPSSHKHSMSESDSYTTLQQPPLYVDARLTDHETPIRIQAKPWTDVTDDDDFVSHLMSLYMTWIFPFLPTSDPDILVDEIQAGNLESSLCSPFLVNIILSRACMQSNRPEACAIPGDWTTAGNHFLSAAQSHCNAEGERASFSSLIALHEMSHHYREMGQEKLSILYARRAFVMSELLSVNDESYVFSKQKRRVRDAAVSGITCTVLLTCPEIVQSSLSQAVERTKSNVVNLFPERVLWTPYPLTGHLLPTNYSLVLNAMYDISLLVQKVRTIPQTTIEGRETSYWRESLQLHRQLLESRAVLPVDMVASRCSSPSIYLLYGLYHYAIIKLFEPFCSIAKGSKIKGDNNDKNITSHTSTKEACHANHMTTTSATDLAVLLRRMRLLFGASRIGGNSMMVLLSYTCCTSLLPKLHTPELRRNFQDAIAVLAASAPRVHLAKCLLRVLLIRVRIESRIILPETEALLGDFKSRVWKRVDGLTFNSEMVTFMSAMKGQDELAESEGDWWDISALLTKYEWLDVAA